MSPAAAVPPLRRKGQDTGVKEFKSNCSFSKFKLPFHFNRNRAHFESVHPPRGKKGKGIYTALYTDLHLSRANLTNAQKLLEPAVGGSKGT